jgi:MoxR-like ATPase
VSDLEVIGRVQAAVSGVVVGKDDALEQLLVAVLCGGHALLEDSFIVEWANNSTNIFIG